MSVAGSWPAGTGADAGVTVSVRTVTAAAEAGNAGGGSVTGVAPGVGW
jgi:hypothetical protein